MDPTPRIRTAFDLFQAEVTAAWAEFEAAHPDLSRVARAFYVLRHGRDSEIDGMTAHGSSEPLTNGLGRHLSPFDIMPAWATYLRQASDAIHVTRHGD